MAVPCSGCRDGTARSPQGFLRNPHFQCLPHSVLLAFWLLLPVELPESSQNRLWHLCIARLLLRRALSLTLGASLFSHSSSLAVFTSSLHLACHVFLGFPLCLVIASLNFSLSHHARVGRSMPFFSIYVRHFTLASRTIFLSLHGLELLI